MALSRPKRQIRKQYNHHFAAYLQYTGYENPDLFTGTPESPYWGMRALMLEIDLRKLLGQSITDKIMREMPKGIGIMDLARRLERWIDALKESDNPVDSYEILSTDFGDLDGGEIDRTPLGGW